MTKDVIKPRPVFAIILLFVGFGWYLFVSLPYLGNAGKDPTEIMVIWTGLISVLLSSLWCQFDRVRRVCLAAFGITIGAVASAYMTGGRTHRLGVWDFYENIWITVPIMSVLVIVLEVASRFFWYRVRRWQLVYECEKCSYDLRICESSVCPECGEPAKNYDPNMGGVVPERVRSLKTWGLTFFLLVVIFTIAPAWIELDYYVLAPYRGRVEAREKINRGDLRIWWLFPGDPRYEMALGSDIVDLRSGLELAVFQTAIRPTKRRRRHLEREAKSYNEEVGRYLQANGPFPYSERYVSYQQLRELFEEVMSGQHAPIGDKVFAIGTAKVWSDSKGFNHTYPTNYSTHRGGITDSNSGDTYHVFLKDRNLHVFFHIDLIWIVDGRTGVDVQSVWWTGELDNIIKAVEEAEEQDLPPGRYVK